MKKWILCFFMFHSALIFAEQESEACSNWISFAKPVCQRINQIVTKGRDEIYISGYAWHNRYTYTPEKIKSYNEAAWGGGLGKGLFDKSGNWHGLYAIGFLDSHRHVEPVVGYAYLKVFHLTNKLKTGLGYTVLVTSRVDIYNSIPFPGILPWATVFYDHVSIAATYIPGAQGAGNVLYLVGKYTF